MICVRQCVSVSALMTNSQPSHKICPLLSENGGFREYNISAHVISKEVHTVLTQYTYFINYNTNKK